MRPDPSTASDLDLEAQLSLTTHGKSFRWAQVFLSREARREAALTYAFCRAVDDAVDEAPSPRDARQAIETFTSMLDGRVPRTPLISAYVDLAKRRGFGLGPAQDLLRGVESDLGSVAVADDAELALYCYRVAGTVGLMMSGILRVENEKALTHAVNLGIAMQLTNICRDVREDAERGRVYLPQTRLTAAGVPVGALLSGAGLAENSRKRSGMKKVVVDLLAVADRAYASGEAGLRFLPVRARLAIAVASRLYAGIGRKLRRTRDGDAWDGRVRLGLIEKCWLTIAGVTLFLRVTLLAPSRTHQNSELPGPWPHPQALTP